MGDKTLGITTEMNVDDISDGLTEIADQLGELPQSQDIDINLTGDALDQVNSLIDSLASLNDEEASPEANLEGSAQESVETLQSDLTSIDNEIVNPEANLDGDAQEDVETLKSDMTDLDSETANPEANLGGDALEDVETLKEDMTELDGDVATPEADLQGDALEKADELREDLEDLNDTTVTPEVDSDSIDESTSSSNDAAKAVAGVTSAIAAVDVEAKRMGTERSLEKALYYEGLPVTVSNVNNLRSSLAQLAPYMPTEESSEGFYILAKGLKNVDDVAAELPAAFKLIKTGAIDTDTAMYDLSSIIATYGLHGQNAADVTSYLNEAFLNLKVSTPTEALNALTGSLRTLKSVGFSAEEITNYISAFDQVGVSADSAVSALTIGAKTLQKQLTTTSYDKSKAKTALDAMKIDAKDAHGNFKSVSDIMDEVIDKTTSMTDAQFQAAYGISKNEALIDLFGSRGALTFGLLKESAQDAGQATTDSANQTTDAMSQTNKQTVTLQTKMQQLWNWIINYPLPDWAFKLAEGGAIAVGILTVVIPLLKKSWDGVISIKNAVSGLKEKLDGLKGTGKIKNPLEEWDEKVFGKDVSVKETVQTKFEIVSDEAGELKTEGDVNSFVEKTKTKLGELKESNVWRMLFGDEKGSLNFNVLDQAEAKIGSFVDSTKSKLAELKGAISTGLDEGYEHYYGGSESASESSETLDKITGKVKDSINKVDGFLDEGYEHYYGNNNKAVESNSETLDKITEKVESTKDKIGEILDEGYEHYYGDTKSFLDDEEGRIRGFNLDDLVNKVSSAKDKITGILDEGYEHYYGNNNKAVESNSETLDKITDQVESTKNKINEILDEGYEHYYGDTKGFLDDEEGTIRGFTFDDLVDKVSSTKNKITGILDEGYEHYYGNNNKAVESNSETLDKITGKFESTKNKINEILDEGYEHYYGDNNKIESSSSETLTKITGKVETTRNKITGILDEGYEHYYGKTESFLDDEEGRVNTSLSDISSRISSFIGDTKAKLGELKDSTFDRIFGDEKGTVTAAEGKVSGFVENTKAKLGELNKYNVFDEVFHDTGEGTTAYSRISGLVDSIKTKVSELTHYNIPKIVTGTETPTTGTGTVTGGSRTGSSDVIDLTPNKEGTYVPDWEGAGSKVAGAAGHAVNGALIAGQIYYDLYHASDLFSEPITKSWNEMTGGSLQMLEDVTPPLKSAHEGIDNVLSAYGMTEPSWGDIYAKVFGGTNAPKKEDFQKYLHDTISAPIVSGWKEFTQNPLSYLGSGLSSIGGGIGSTISKALGGVKLQSSYKMPKISWSGLTSGLDGAKTTVQTKLGQLQQYVSSHVTSKLPKVNWSTIHQGLDSAKSTVQGKWGQLKQYVSSHAPNTKLNWTTIHQGLDTAKNTVQTKWGQLQQYVTQHTPKVKVPTWADVEKGLDPAKQWVQNEWNALKTYVESHVPKVPIPKWSDIEKGEHEAVQWVENTWNGFMQWLGTLPGKMWNYGQQIINGLIQGIESKIPGLNYVLGLVGDPIRTSSPPKVGPLSTVTPGGWASWGASLINGFTNGISSGKGLMNSTLASIESTTSGFLGNMTSVASNLFSTGVSMVSNLASGLSAGLPDLSSVFSEISNMFPHSPPKTGPLASIKAENMKAWTKNIAQAGVEGLSHFTGYMDEMVQLPRLSNLSSPGLTKSFNNSQAGQTVINLTVAEGAVVIQGNADENVVKNAGAIFGESAADKLSRQANNRGYSTVNVIR
jgi:hypothetical protein